LRICFQGEKAVDLGGVYRDMLSAFWDETYYQIFDGESLLSPALHPQVELSHFAILGTILSHEYLSSGFLPVRVFLPSLAIVLFGENAKIEDMLC